MKYIISAILENLVGSKIEEIGNKRGFGLFKTRQKDQTAKIMAKSFLEEIKIEEKLGFLRCLISTPSL